MPNIKSSILDDILKELDSFVVAFSCGVDSSFLLHRSRLASDIYLWTLKVTGQEVQILNPRKNKTD